MDLEYARYFKHYHIIIWGTSAILAAIPAQVYGPAGDWCWIPQSHGWYRLTFYVPLVLSLPVMLAVVGWGQVVISKQAASLTTHRALLATRRRKLYMRVLGLTVIFVFCWTAAVINRLTEINGASSFTLAFLQGCMDPLQGFLNAVVFFCIPKVRAALPCCRACLPSSAAISASAAPDRTTGVGSSLNASPYASPSLLPPGLYPHPNQNGGETDYSSTGTTAANYGSMGHVYVGLRT